MELSPYQLALLGGGFTLLGGFIGNWVTHHLTDFRNSKERHINNYEAFRNALLPSVQILIKESGTFTARDFNNFMTYYPAQETAMLKVLSDMRRCRATIFRKKWTEYREWYKQCYDNYESCVLVVGQHSSREEGIKLINKLIETAKKY